MEILAFLLLSFLLAIGGSILFEITGKKKSRALIQKWAEAEEITIKQIDQPLLESGPFQFSFSKMQRIYRVTIISGNEERILWARSGNRWFGLFKPELTIKEEEDIQQKA